MTPIKAASPARFALAALAAVMLPAAPALAGAVVALPLDLGSQGTVSSAVYSCSDGTELNVQYINTDANALAIIPLAGEELIFVNVVSGSGARYVNGAREWVTKGDDGMLNDELAQTEALKCSDKAAAKAAE
ncbi:hypothetical protein DC366_04075 [Pelagivirga sediminicola]|uniref:C-type lysozyme inhibitor domain-containing protein n=1 Tax=Pelagivirga sediminicola TaxID=2170575 RepID=A0A2T7G981_9RHOB|nr:MliC family protein [Pelagivirga sediminicola]PVA10971.1 hypothetical protein DC366_04075 [Pelagivirga sediminicola]